MNLRSSHIVETVWIITGLACLYMAIKITVSQGFSAAVPFYLLAILALLMYVLRSSIRKKRQS